MKSLERLSLTTLLIAVCPLVLGCPSDDSPPQSDGSSGTSTGDTTTSSDPDSTGNAESSSTSTGDSDPDSSSSDDGDTTGEPAGICVGIEALGELGFVYARDGLPVDPTCDSTAVGCGGDVVGTWLLEGSCGYEIFPNPLAEDCPNSTFTVNIVSEEATATFEADGTFTQNQTVESEGVFTLDTMDCFNATCEEFGAALQEDTPEAMCADTKGVCTCTVPNGAEATMTSGTYQTLDDLLVLTSDGDEQDLTYCVQGDRLSLWQTAYDLVVTEEACADVSDCEAALGDMYPFYVCATEEPKRE